MRNAGKYLIGALVALAALIAYDANAGKIRADGHEQVVVMGQDAGYPVNTYQTGGSPFYNTAPTQAQVILPLADGGTLVTAADASVGYMAGRRRFELVNGGLNYLCCTQDGTIPVVTSPGCSVGRYIAADKTASWDEAIGNYAVRCVVSTAVQTTGNASTVSEWP